MFHAMWFSRHLVAGLASRNLVSNRPVRFQHPLVLAQGRAGISSTVSVRKRKEKSKQHFEYTRVPPRAVQRGDFPVQVRPVREIRDIHDRSFDELADHDKSPAKTKPHKIREAVHGVQPAQGAISDKASTSRLWDQKRLASEVPSFDMDSDLPEHDAAELSAQRARRLAQRSYKWVPNPFGSKPGPLGTSAAAEAKYYERYFDGSGKQTHERPWEHGGAAGDEELREKRPRRGGRERISPKRFWYQADYVSPDPQNVSLMTSRDLKYAMVNEAHEVRKWRQSQPEGRAAGIPRGGDAVWMAFGYRAAELAAPLTLNSRQPCSIATALRFLQAMASVQAGPHSALCRIASRVTSELQSLRPSECFFLLQALARLRLRHPKASLALRRLSLTWRTLSEKQFIKAANAVAKLDLGSESWARYLKLALAKALPRLSGRRLSELKAITVIELLDEPESMRLYLEHCVRNRASIWYTRHLHMVEVHVHLVHPALWASLGEDIRTALQESRDTTLASQGWQTRPPTPRSNQPDALVEGGSDSEDLSDDECRSYDKQVFASLLHSDVSRIVTTRLGIELQNRVSAGPLSLDMCHLPSMTVVEAAEHWQYYLHSTHFTALARRRHELVRAMGFRLVLVPCYRWETFTGDDEKVAYLRQQLPAELLSYSRESMLPQTH